MYTCDSKTVLHNCATVDCLWLPCVMSPLRHTTANASSSSSAEQLAAVRHQPKNCLQTTLNEVVLDVLCCDISANSPAQVAYRAPEARETVHLQPTLHDFQLWY